MDGTKPGISGGIENVSRVNTPAAKASSQAGPLEPNTGLSGSRVGNASSQAGPSEYNTRLTGTPSEIGRLTRSTSHKRFLKIPSSGVLKTFLRTPPKGTTRGPLLKVTPSPYGKLEAAEIGEVRDHEEPEDDGEGPWGDALFFRPSNADVEGEDDEDDEGDKAKADDAIAPEMLDNDDGDYEE